MPIELVSSSRIKFMETAEDIVGPKDTSVDWRPQIVAATQEGLRNNGYDASKTPWAQTFEAWAKATEHFRRNYQKVGWDDVVKPWLAQFGAYAPLPYG